MKLVVSCREYMLNLYLNKKIFRYYNNSNNWKNKNISINNNNNYKNRKKQQDLQLLPLPKEDLISDHY